MVNAKLSTIFINNYTYSNKRKMTKMKMDVTIELDLDGDDWEEVDVVSW